MPSQNFWATLSRFRRKLAKNHFFAGIFSESASFFLRRRVLIVENGAKSWTLFQNSALPASNSIKFFREMPILLR
jgi:hypothetical protein